MVGLDNPRYFRHITEHLNNPHINFIELKIVHIVISKKV